MNRNYTRLLIISLILRVFVPCHISLAEEVSPSGRIEGTIRLGGKPLADAEVVCATSPSQDREARREHSTRTDENGRYVLDKIEADEYRIGLMKFFPIENGYSTESGMLTRTKEFTLKPGETARIDIDDIGRTVTGQLVPPKNYKKQIAWQGGSLRMLCYEAEKPYPANLSEDERKQWEVDWQKTEAWKSWHRAQRLFVMDIDENGALRAENIPAGSYSFIIEADELGVHSAPPKGCVQGKFMLPEIADGPDGRIHDLGEIEITMAD